MTTKTAARFGFSSTTDEVLEGIDLQGKVVLVTGASSGLGAETARALASKGAKVTLAARQLEKTRAIAEQIRTATGNKHLDVAELDLTSFDNIRDFVKTFLEKNPALHILINNAGVMACPFGRTPSGCELQFGTNHIGHFLLTCLLVPALRAGAPARVICLSSGGHKYSPVVFEDLHFEKRPYDKWLAYGQSKTANVLFAVELNRRLERLGVNAFAVHPGVIVTELGRHLTKEDIEAFSKGMRGRGEALRRKSIEQGAATTVWAASSPQLKGKGGLYLEDCQIATPSEEPGTPRGYMPYATDERAAKKLWEISEQIVGETFAL